MNYEGMSTPQSTLCSRTGMFECLTVTHKIHLFLFISGSIYWLPPSLLTSPWGRLPTETLLPPGFALVSPVFLLCQNWEFPFQQFIQATLVHYSFLSGSLSKRPVFLCFQIICVSPSFNPHFSKGSHSGQQLLSEKLGHYSGKEKKTEMMYAKNDMRQLCVAKWFKKKKMEETSAREEELNLHRHWEYNTTIWGQ